MRLIATLLFVCFSGLVFSQVTLEADIRPGSASSFPESLIVYNGKLYFVADDVVHGEELWVFNDTTAQLAYDINSGSADSYPKDFYIHDGKLYFTARNATSSNSQRLYVLDEDTLYCFNNTSLVDPYFQTFQNKLYFSNSEQGVGTELYVLANDSIFLASDIYPGPSHSFPQYLTVYKNKLFFSATMPISGRELFSYNGSLVQLEADMSPSGSSSPSYLYVWNGKLYFTTGVILNSFDGANVSNLANPYGLQYFRYRRPFDGKLFFPVVLSGGEVELGSYDGVNFTSYDLAIGSASSTPVQSIVYNDRLVTSVYQVLSYELSYYQNTLITFDGDTFMNVATAFTQLPQYMTVYREKLFFSCSDGTTGTELWSLTLPKPCNPPTNLNTVISGSSSATLKWDENTNALGYVIRGKAINSSSFVTISVNNPSTTSYAATGLSPSQTYVWQIKSICDTGGVESEYSKFDTFRIDVCDVPSPSTTTDITSNSAILRWTKIPSATGYRVIGKEYYSSKLENIYLPASKDSLVATNLAPNKTYVWQVRAECSSSNTSLFTNINSFSTGQTVAPKNIEADMGLVLVYPNPMDEYTIVESTGAALRKILVFDIRGAEVMSINTDSYSHRIDRNNLSNGVYFLYIETETGQYREKLVLN